MARAYNFCAGPAALPDEVLFQAQEEIADWHGVGTSVMEMSHRSKEFVSIAEEATQDFRDLLSIGDDYEVLFLQGGASSQFSMIPLNLLGDNPVADYVNTGQWSKKAIAEAKRYCDVNVVATSESQNFSTVPAFEDWALSDNPAYLHYTPNETIGGVEFDYIPEVKAPLVADYSSSILSESLDVSKFGLIYAGAQKNIGPAGLTIVIVRKDLLGKAKDFTPAMFNYETHAKSGSMNNTPPTYSWYLAGLVFKWLKRQGGVSAMAELNKRKAEKLYGFIDNSAFYANPVEPRYRSRMNVPFTLADDQLDSVFLKKADEAKLLNLAGHRSVGGMRASIYNAVSENAVDALIAFMADFEKAHG
ncbi:3-phosphoserine/phosphohydroxythreonine transaminase [Litoribacillus peritrichatus]|uniref:Phosphoserine aminotransferase n=1 Tax=Litoribacillus peritrichatus TaxID=718191 RepID=A0ABP7M8Z4_9GAMM